MFCRVHGRPWLKRSFSRNSIAHHLQVNINALMVFMMLGAVQVQVDILEDLGLAVSPPCASRFVLRSPIDSLIGMDTRFFCKSRRIPSLNSFAATVGEVGVDRGLARLCWRCPGLRFPCVAERNENSQKRESAKHSSTMPLP